MAEPISNSNDGLITGGASTVNSVRTDSNSKVGNLHSVNPEIVKNEKVGRVVVQFADMDKYDSEKYVDPLVMLSNEICVDKDNILWVSRVDETGKLVWRSAMKEMYDMFKNFENLGILDSAYAFGINGKVYNMLFDSAKKWVGINPELNFEPIYRYYAIREMYRNEDGGYNYLTGIYAKNPLNNQMELLTNRVDMDRVPASSGDGRTVSKPRQASLIGKMEHGGKYVVEFYDDDNVLRGTEVFQALAVKSLEYALAPDKCITGLIVKPNNEGVEANTCFLFTNDVASEALSFRVFLKYADDSLVDITAHQYTTGRLVIDGLDAIETTRVTGPDDEPQKVRITYYFTKDNSNIQDGELAESGDVDVGTLSITQEIKVFIKESLYDDVVKVVPAGWITYPNTNPNQKIFLKLFGVYKSGVVKDISNFVSTNNRFSGFASGTSKYDSVTNGYYADSQYIGGLPESPIVRVPQGRGTTMKSFTFRMETSTSHRRLVIDNESSVFLKFNSTTKRMTFDNTQTLERIKELNSYEYENSFLAPTHFTVRSVLDPSAVLARNVPIENALTGFIYTSVLDDVLASDYPLLVEFMKIDIVDGMIDKVFSTNCSRYYAQKVSS